MTGNSVLKNDLLCYLCVKFHIVGDDAHVVIEFDLLLHDFFYHITNTSREDQQRYASVVQLQTAIASVKDENV